MKWQEIKIIIIIIKFSFTWIRNIPCDTNAEGIYKWKLNTMTKKLITITKDMPGVNKLRESTVQTRCG